MSSANETETFQHYQVAKRPDGTLWELGRGAMGITYKAFDTNLRTDVALKVVNAMLLNNETARARFQREARAAAGLRHRNVATVYHLGNDDQSFFYAMEYIDGETVECMVKRQSALKPVDALQIIVQVARALGAAAKQNLVHRDIKPANLMVMREDEDEDQLIVKVIDFGLARPALGGEGSAHITMGGFVGTPQFASPEQLEEKDLDTRSDIYSLGITLWYMLAGKPPFSGPLGSVFIQQLTKEPPWDQLAGLATPVHDLLAHMLQKDPDKRQQSPVELRREVEACIKALSKKDKKQSGLISPARPVETPEADSTADTREAGSDETDVVIVAADTDTGTNAVSDSEVSSSVDLEAVSSSARTAALTLGSLLGGRYELTHFAGDGTNGRVFQARDNERNGAFVALKILHLDVLNAPGERRRLEGEIGKLRQAGHPNLIEVFGLEEAGDTAFLVMEWVNGFTLVDLLRSRGQLPLREAAQLLVQSVTAADFARAHDLRRIELGLHQILAHFPTVTGGADSESGTKTALGRPLDQWPDFTLKLDALGIAREVGDSLTWGGDLTVMPTAPQLGRDTQTSIRGFVEGSDLFALGMLLYELLNGAPPALNQRNDNGREARYVALPALNEAANLVLRRALSPNPGFASNREFFDALMEASGLVQPPTPTAPPDVTPSGSTTVARTLVDAPIAPSETLIFDEPLATANDEADSAATLIFEEKATPSSAPLEQQEQLAETPVLRDKPLAVDISVLEPAQTDAPAEPPEVTLPPELAEQDSAQTMWLEPVVSPMLEGQAAAEDKTLDETPPNAETPLAVEAKADLPKPPEEPEERVSAPVLDPQETLAAVVPSVETSSAPEELPADIIQREEKPVAAESVVELLSDPDANVVSPPPKEEEVISAAAAALPLEITPTAPKEVAPAKPPPYDRADISLDLPPVKSPEPLPAEESRAPRRDIQLPKREELPVSTTPAAKEPTLANVIPQKSLIAKQPERSRPEQRPVEEENQGGGRKLLMIGGAAVVALLVVGGSVAFLSRGPRQPAQASNPSPAVRTIDSAASNPPGSAASANPTRNDAAAASATNSTVAAAAYPSSATEQKSQTNPSAAEAQANLAAITMPPLPSPAEIIAAPPAPELSVSTPSASRKDDSDKNQDDDNGKSNTSRRVTDARSRRESTPAPTPSNRAREREANRSEPQEPKPRTKPAEVSRPAPSPKQAPPATPKPSPDARRPLPNRQPGLN